MDVIADHETVLEGFSNRIRRVLLTGALIFVSIIIAYLFVVGEASPNRSAAAAPAQAEPVCYPAIADTNVSSSLPDSNFGGNQTMDLGLFQGTTNQMYLQFDISKIPANATIISGNVQAYMHFLETSEKQFQTALHSPEGSWEELKLTWNNQPGMSSNYGASVLDTSTGWKVWDATNLVAQWHAGVLPNAGVVIVPDPFDPLAYNQASFASREDPDRLIPQLCVVFEDPLAPKPTRTPLPTRTPIPTNRPTPGPTPTATPPVFTAPYLPIAEISIGTLFQPDLSIHGIEITQGIQCFDTSKGLASCADNSMPVVTKKDSTARIYLKYNGILSAASNIPVRLYIRANGVWYTANGLGKATKTIDQSKYDDTRVYFNVNFTNDIPVDFYAIVDPNGTISETNESNNRFPASGYITLNFRRRDNLKIVGDRL
ncbi:MAG: DNRLRE domain-containing protein, partial [Anaerolineales bacterium]|nr:DNRLRE domain-containing protein [Anaerolineales bacterium]